MRYQLLASAGLYALACMAPETGTRSMQGIHVGGDHPRTHKPVVVLSGEGALIEGTVLGQITRGARTATTSNGVPAPAGATATASPAATTVAEVGVHRFVCCVAGATTTSKWNHFNPAGEFVGQATGNTEYVGGGLTLTITDSGTDPAVGEVLLVTVTQATPSKKWKKSLAAATDGSQTPRAILASAVDATSADATGPGWIEGHFAQEALTYGTGHTATTVEQAFRDNAIPLYLDSVGTYA